jgi:hypothetical protein
MPQLSVLFADDHIPDFDLPADDTQAIEVVRNHHPSCPVSGLPDFLKAHRHCQAVAKTLRNAAFDLTTVNKHKNAIATVKKQHFDIAVVDLGWYNDESLPRNEDYRATAGWEICKQIDESTKKLGGRPTLQIISSSRFKEEKEGPDLLTTAARDGRLPFVKMEGSQLNLEALRACVRFMEKNLDETSPEAIAERSLQTLERMRDKYLDEPLKELRIWTAVSLVVVCVGCVLIVAALVKATFGHLEVKVLTSLSSVITTVVGALFYRRLEKLQAVLSKQLEGLRVDIKATWEKAIKLAS